MKKYIALAALLFVLTGSCFAQTESSPQIRRKTFEKIWQTVNDKFYDANFGGVDWKSARVRYGAQVAAVKTDREFYELMKTMLGELKVSHLQILTPDTLAHFRAVDTTTGLTLREIGNRLVITRLFEDSSAAKANLKTGFVVTKIGGEAVNDLKDANRKLFGEPNTSVSISYLNATDEEHEATLTRVALNESDRQDLGGGLHFYAHFESRRLNEDIGYLHFTNFLQFLNPRITTAIESFKDTKGIIIDLRGNGGGEDSVALNIANMLFDKKTQLMITKTRKGDNFYYKAKPAKNPYRGKVVILIDEHSGSASEQIAAGMQEAGRAYIVGATTKGADLDAQTVALPMKALFLYAYGQPRTPKGIVIEGRGVVPDKEVNLTRENLLAEHDAHLEAAIEYIKNGK